MADFNIASFRAALGTGSKPNLFKVTVTPPTGIPALTNFEFQCRSGALPSSTMGTIEIPMNAGRRLKMGGDRTFTEWTSTVLNDEGYVIRTIMEQWQNALVKTNFDLNSIGNRSASVTSGLYGTVNIYQLKEDGSSVPNGTYKLVNCWPSDISAIDLSYDTTDAVEDFTVTWTYDFFENNFSGEAGITALNAAVTTTKGVQ
jgi:hypothetical protein